MQEGFFQVLCAIWMFPGTWNVKVCSLLDLIHVLGKKQFVPYLSSCDVEKLDRKQRIYYTQLKIWKQKKIIPTSLVSPLII